MSSIRSALLRRFSATSFALMLLGTVLLMAGVRRVLTDLFDDSLGAKLATFATLLEQEGHDIELALQAQNMPQFSAEVDPEYVQIRLATSGESLYRSASLGEDDLPHLGGTLVAPEVREIRLPEGRVVRVIGAEFAIQYYEAGTTDPGAAWVALAMAVGREPLDRALALLLGGAAGGIALLLGAGFFFGRDAVQRGLRPLDALAGHVGAIDDPREAPLHPLAGLPQELEPLVRSHNAMLERIRTAFERERRTTANIAHELRAPVSELVMLADTARRYPADTRETERRLSEVVEIGQHLAGLIATMLELARVESGQVPLEIEPIDLAEMVRACWAPLEPAAAAKGQDFHAPSPGATVQADRAILSILLANLLGNAVAHGASDEPIRCDVGSGDRTWRLVLTNGARGLRREDVDKLTEPFWRASPSRADKTHAGIGLSLARRLAEILDVDIQFALDESVFQAQLEFSSSALDPKSA